MKTISALVHRVFFLSSGKYGRSRSVSRHKLIMIVMKSLLFLIALLLFWGNLMAQGMEGDLGGKAENSLSLIAQSRNGQVQIRWAPSNPAVWMEGLKRGYYIERQEVIAGQAFRADEFERLNNEPYLPFTREEWKRAVEQRPENTYLLVAAECIHGEWKDARSAGSRLRNWIYASDNLKNRFSFHLFSADLDFYTALASGLAFVDETAEPGRQYIYKVYILGKEGEKQYTAYQTIINKTTAEPVPHIHSVQNGEGKVVLSWDRKSHERHFSAYHIERSRDGEHFKRITDLPFLHAVSPDSALYSPNVVFIDEVENYQPYFYRISGATPFGEWSAPSEAVRGMGVDKTAPPAARDVRAEWLGDTRIELKWEVEAPEEVDKFYVARAFDYNGPFELLTSAPMLPGTAFSFVDSTATPFGINYYVVGAVDTAGNASVSQVVAGFIEDKEAPSSPLGLRGAIDSTGVVHLEWSQGTEKDLKGYHVYFSNAKKDVFTNLTNKPIPATEYTDTISLHTLSRKVYYRVAAVDRRGNYSSFSDFLELDRPDIIPPSAPLFKSYKILDKGVLLSWAPSSSLDVSAQFLYRKREGEDWQLYRSFTSTVEQFIDEEIAAHTFYEYKLIAKDEAGLRSEVASVLRVKTAGPAKDLSIVRFSAVEDAQKQEVLLSWEFEQASENPVQRLILYRATADAPLLTLTSAKPHAQAFTDESVKEGRRYAYAYKVVYSDGRRSPMSEVVRVQL
jgi:fibronectin type 3 domain-containing protein